MAADRRRRQRRESRPQDKALIFTLLTVAIVLLVVCGALWIASEGRPDPTPTPPVVALVQTKTAEPTAEPSNPLSATIPATANPAPRPSLPVGPKENYLAPGFKLRDLNGEEKSLSEFQGKIVLLNFWATWCGPCRIEIPDLKAVYNKYKNKDFVVLAVDIGETSGTVSRFVKQFGMEFPVLLDSTMSVARQYGAFSIPSSFFIDRQGVIRTVRIGAMPQSYIEEMVSRLLSEQ